MTFRRRSTSPSSRPLTQLEPLVVPSISGSVFFYYRPPPSRLTTAEVFRPPRVRA